MKLLLALVLGLLASGCGIHTLHTESYEVDKDGNKWERHYLVIPYKSPVKGDVGELHKAEPKYNMKTHKVE